VVVVLFLCVKLKIWVTRTSWGKEKGLWQVDKQRVKGTGGYFPSGLFKGSVIGGS
jgi:hypothetical protein